MHISRIMCVLIYNCYLSIVIYFIFYLILLISKHKYIIIDDNFNIFGGQQIYRKYQQWYLRLSLLMQFDNRKSVL